MSDAEQDPEDTDDGLTTFSVGMSMRGHLAVRARDAEHAADLAREHGLTVDFDSADVDRADVTEDPDEEPDVDPEGRLYANEHVPMPSIPSPVALGSRLREVRTALGMSIRDVVDHPEGGLSQGTVSRLERGRTTNLDLYTTYARLLNAIRSEVGDE